MARKKTFFKDREQALFASKCKFLTTGDTVFSKLHGKKGTITLIDFPDPKFHVDNFIVTWEDGKISSDHYPHQLCDEPVKIKESPSPQLTDKICDRCSTPGIKYYGLDILPTQEKEIYKCLQCGWVENIKKKAISFNDVASKTPKRKSKSAIN